MQRIKRNSQGNITDINIPGRHIFTDKKWYETDYEDDYDLAQGPRGPLPLCNSSHADEAVDLTPDPDPRSPAPDTKPSVTIDIRGSRVSDPFEYTRKLSDSCSCHRERSPACPLNTHATGARKERKLVTRGGCLCPNSY